MARLGRLLALMAGLLCGGMAMAADRENTIYLDVPAGRVVIALRPDLAPASKAATWFSAAQVSILGV